MQSFNDQHFSRDGSRLASLTEEDDDYCNLRLRNTKNGQLIGVAEGVGHKLAISDNGSLVATGNSLSLIDTLDLEDGILSLAFSRDLLAIGCAFFVNLYNFKRHSFVASIPSLALRSSCHLILPGSLPGVSMFFN